MSRHARSSSARLENNAFREAISRMRTEVLESKAETQRVQDQLNCLVMLVKRAWMGDQASALHVANIVGVPPPKFKDDSDSDEVSATNKTVHHWAMLSIGLLNRHYKQLEQQALAKAKSRLQRRQDFLDEQLSAHRDMLRRAAGNRLATVKKNNQNLYLEQQNDAGKYLKSRNRRPHSSPIHRSTYGSTHTNGAKDLAANNLTQYMAGATYGESQIMSKQNDRRGSGGNKYIQPGLFDISSVVADKSKKARPTSAHLHQSDAKRAQPRSTVVIKGERPLKYETTRPVSAKVTSTTSKPMTDKPPRAKSAKVRSSTAPKTLFHDGFSLLDSEEWSPEGLRSHGRTFVTEQQDSVEAFTQDMRHMQTMEDDFARTAKMLQQKLGISGEGVI